MLRPALVLAQLARFLVLCATRRVDRLAAVDRRHLLLHAALERGPDLVLARRVRLLAQITLLRVARLTAVRLLRLRVHALPTLGTTLVAAGLDDLPVSFLARLALLGVGRRGAVGRRTHPRARAAASHTGPRTHPRARLCHCRQGKQSGSDGSDDQ